MADKNQSADAQAASGAKDTVDYQAKYKEAQGNIERLTAENKKNVETLDAVTPFVDWDRAQGKGKKPETDEEIKFYNAEEVETLRSQDRERSDNKLLEVEFKIQHPDLNPVMKYLPAHIADARAASPRATKEELLQMAATSLRESVESIKAGALKEAKDKKAEEDELKASGLDASGNTVPIKEEAAQTDNEYIAEREARLAQQKSPVVFKPA